MSEEQEMQVHHALQKCVEDFVRDNKQLLKGEDGARALAVSLVLQARRVCDSAELTLLEVIAAILADDAYQTIVSGHAPSHKVGSTIRFSVEGHVGESKMVIPLEADFAETYPTATLEWATRKPFKVTRFYFHALAAQGVGIVQLYANDQPQMDAAQPVPAALFTEVGGDVRFETEAGTRFKLVLKRIEQPEGN